MKRQRPIRHRGRLNRTGWKMVRAAWRPSRLVLTLAGTGGVCVLVEASRSGARVRVVCNGADYMRAAFRRLSEAKEYAYGQFASMVADPATSIRPA